MPSKCVLLYLCLPIFINNSCNKTNCSIIPHNTLELNTIPHNTIQHNTSQYNTIHHNTCHLADIRMINKSTGVMLSGVLGKVESSPLFTSHFVLH